MIKGDYWHTGVRADLIRPWPELPSISGYPIMVVTKNGVFEATVQVKARQTLVVAHDVSRVAGSVGWFPR